MRVVIDTNVFISAGLKHGSPPSNTVHLAVKHDLLLKSEATEQELFITLARPRLAVLIPSLFQDWLRDVLDTAELVSISERLPPAVILRTINSWKSLSAAERI